MDSGIVSEANRGVLVDEDGEAPVEHEQSGANPYPKGRAGRSGPLAVLKSSPKSAVARISSVAKFMFGARGARVAEEARRVQGELVLAVDGDLLRGLLLRLLRRELLQDGQRDAAVHAIAQHSLRWFTCGHTNLLKMVQAFF